MEKSKGYIFGALSYVIWGIMPFYWKLLQEIGPTEILAYRILFSSLFMLVVLLVSRKIKETFKEVKQIFSNRQKTVYLLAGTVLISVNWLLFITTVTNGHVAGASLGYYINPLLNVLVGRLMFKEEITRSTAIASAFGLLGVLILSIDSGTIPWLSIAIAGTFSLYGATKKKVAISSATSLFMETLLLSPLAFYYLVISAGSSFSSFDLSLQLILSGAGMVTVVPLFLFSAAAKRLPYIVLGFIQYIGPTLMLLSAVFVFKEAFSVWQFAGYISVWAGIAFFLKGYFPNKNKERPSLEIKEDS